ncbi:hypothetical protein GCM10009087_05660 [Sphingomonas oligophenolica]
MKNDFKALVAIGLKSGAAVAALVWAIAAQAQTTPNGADQAPGAASVQPGDTPRAAPDVVVTGSRIRGAAPVGSPLIEQARADLVASGATNTTRLVQNLPQVINQGVTENSRSTSGGAGNITLSYEHSGHTALNGANRGFYAADLTGRGGGDYRGVQCNPANLVINGTSCALPGLSAGTVNKCDTLKGQDLMPSQRRDSVMGSISQDIGSRIHLSADLLYTRRTFEFTPARPTATLTVPVRLS